MRPAMIYFALGTLWMAGIILYGFVAGNIWEEAKIMIHYPWFQISMVDLYTGLSLFSGWVLFRERSKGVAAVWIVLFVLLGNLATCAYALIAAAQSGGDWHTFWTGKRSTNEA